jgi:tripartite-type tricarboxylate transporter receptor subunit TctC
MERRNFIKLGFGCALASLFPLQLPAQNFPVRPIKLVVPFAPGGLVDVIGRLWTEKVRETIGTIIVENEGGAGGALGANNVARSDADGYTILLGNSSTQVLTPAATLHPPYMAEDFTAISIICVSATCIVVSPGLPVKSLGDLIAYAKAHPGKLSYGSAGARSMTNLAGELFKSLAGTPDIVHVPYKGVAPATSDLMSGQIPILTPNITAQLLGLNKAGKIRILAVNARHRLKGAPDIPTSIEQGLDGMDLQVFNGLFAPAKTDRVAISALSDATQKALADEAFQERLITSGFEPVVNSSPANAQRYVDDETRRLTPIIKAVGFTI